MGTAYAVVPTILSPACSLAVIFHLVHYSFGGLTVSSTLHANVRAYFRLLPDISLFCMRSQQWRRGRQVLLLGAQPGAPSASLNFCCIREAWWSWSYSHHVVRASKDSVHASQQALECVLLRPAAESSVHLLTERDWHLGTPRLT